MSTGYGAASQSGQGSKGRHLAIILLGIALLFSLLPPGPASSSTREVDVTATVTLSPLEVIASAPSEVRVGKVFSVEAIIRNLGDLWIDQAVASIYLPNDIEIVVVKPKHDLGDIAAHKYTTVTWRLRAVKEGNYIILILASGRYGGVTVAGDDTVLVAVTPR